MPEQINQRLLYPNKDVRILIPPDGISPNFFLHELSCHTSEGKPCPYCKGAVVAIPYGLDLIQNLRIMVWQYNEGTGFPRGLKINRSYSCEKHNAEIPNASPTSVHLWGGAYDVDSWYNNIVPLEMAKLGEAAGFKRIGIYSWGCHFDIGFELGIRPRPAKWGEWGE